MKIQSYIDLITNSSTSVFTWADNTEGVKEIINAILKASGSDLTCDDMFDISISYDLCLSNTDGYYIESAEKILKDTKDEHLTSLLKSYKKEYEKSKVNWEEVENFHQEIYNILVNIYGEKTLDEWAENFNENSWDYRYSSSYIIKPKKPEYKECADTLAVRLDNLFSYDASYC